MRPSLKRNESGIKAVRRMVRRETKAALKILNRGDGAPRATAIHDARKNLQRARAAVRLGRNVLGKNEYRRENEILRDAARPLGEIRDSKVLIDALDALARRATAPQRRILRQLRSRLIADRRAVRHRLLQEENVLRVVRKRVRSVRKRNDRWPRRGGWPVLSKNLERVYRAGREACAAARKDASNENLHECRKQAKYLRHQLKFLEDIEPARMEKLESQAHALTDRLGDDHDLAVLRERLEAARAALPEDALQKIEPMIEKQRTKLQRDAMALADKLYDATPSRFVAQLSTYWHAWRNGASNQ